MSSVEKVPHQVPSVVYGLDWHCEPSSVTYCAVFYFSNFFFLTYNFYSFTLSLGGTGSTCKLLLLPGKAPIYGILATSSAQKHVLTVNSV